MLSLRPYQKDAIQETYDWMRKNKGNPVINLPTGAGKSIIIAELCKDALTNWPDTKIIMLTHVKELIEQNANKLRQHWPNAPMGIYSASVGKKELGNPITFAGIQSVRGKAAYFGKIDLVICDECHLISHKEEGGYRDFLEELKPSRIIGLTASPYRLGHGMITDKPAIFDGIIEPTTIPILQGQGYLAKLTSKHPHMTLSVEGVHKRGGDYIESELQAMVDTDKNNQEAVAETIERAKDRKSWLFFCTGVKHSEHIRDILREHGISAEMLSGETTKVERERIIQDFKDGKIRALTNTQILTTGFDYPDIDCIVFLRPTCSPGLYLQMAGRGLRVKSNGGDCMILDFAGVIEKHGPITAIKPPKTKGNGDGVAPCKICPECDEMVAIQTLTCPECGFKFPAPEKKEEIWNLRDDDIMGIDTSRTMHIDGWKWRVHTSITSGKEMMKVTYYGKLGEKIDEYLCIWHEGYAGEKATKQVNQMLINAGYEKKIDNPEQFNEVNPPSKIVYKMDGKFPKIIRREWTKPC
jgi:DNA repair protein RadD